MSDFGLKQLLSRTNLVISFEDFLVNVKKVYEFNKVYRYTPFLNGYEDASIKIDTEKGNFVIKIFSKSVSHEEVLGDVKVINSGIELGIPFPRLLLGNNQFFQHIYQGDNLVEYIIMEFFEGKSLDEQEVTLDDINSLVRLVALLHTLDFPVVNTYDSWGNKNLVSEYEANKEGLSPETDYLIKPTVDKLKSTDFSNFSRSIIHGDLQRKNLLKNSNDKYCFLDLGCMRNDAKVYDLSIFLAWVCLSDTQWELRETIVEDVIDEYTKVHKLSSKELKALPILVKASYAAYFLKTSILIGNGDSSEETKAWFEKSKRMLLLMSSWDLKL